MDDLLAAARAGDRDALNALAARVQPQVYRFGLRMCGNPEDAGDVLQDTLLGLARSIGRFRGDAALSTWLFTIARRACLRKRRRSRFAPRHVESLDSLDAVEREQLSAPGRTPEDIAAAGEMTAALDAALAALPASQREVLLLRDVEGLSAAEVANVLGIGVAAVKSRLHRARQALQAQLAPVLRPPAPPSSAAPCPDVLKAFSRYLEGDLPPEACASMEAHLKGCPRCDGTCASLRQVLALCRSAPAPAVPAAVDRSVRQALRAFLDARGS